MPSNGLKEFATILAKSESVYPNEDNQDKKQNFCCDILEYFTSLLFTVVNIIKHFLAPYRTFEISFDRIISKFSFIPPHNTYSFKFNEACASCGEMVLFNLPGQICPGRIEQFSKMKHYFECFFAHSSRGNGIACVYISCDNPKLQREDGNMKTIVYSHTNAEDIGSSISYLWRLRRKLRCNIFSYDYSGYGLSSGCPSESNLYADINAALDELVKRKKLKLSQIVLVGESIGSVPTIFLASRKTYAGVIIQSAFTSGFRIYFPYDRPTVCFDPFPNIERVPLIKSKTLMVHGTQDQLVHISHAIAIHSLLTNPVAPLWVEGAAHMTIHNFAEYYPRLQHFINKQID